MKTFMGLFLVSLFALVSTLTAITLMQKNQQKNQQEEYSTTSPYTCIHGVRYRKDNDGELTRMTNHYGASIYCIQM